MARTLILCPTYDHQDTLFASIASVQGQTVEDWELVVIGDGAPERTGEIVGAISSADPRVRYLPKPKSPRIAEPWRDEVIRGSDAEFVLQINDDDLWFPDHIETILAGLERWDWVSTWPVIATISGNYRATALNAAAPEIRSAMRSAQGVSLNVAAAGFRRSSYFRLANGYETPPDNRLSVVHMWSNFAKESSIIMACLPKHTNLNLFAADRKSMTSLERLAELQKHMTGFLKPGGIDNILKDIRYGPTLHDVWRTCGANPNSDLATALGLVGLRFSPATEPAVSSSEIALLELPVTDSQKADILDAWALYQGKLNGDELTVVLERFAQFQGDRDTYWRKLLANTDRSGWQAILDKWVATAPGAPTPYLHLAVLRLEAGEYRAAIDACEQGLAIPLHTPHLATVRDLYLVKSRALNRLERPQDALEALDHPLRHNADFAPVHELHARILEKLGLGGDALSAWREAVRISPNRVQYRNELDRLINENK